MLNKAIIDLSVLQNNAKLIKKRLPKNTEFCAVIKADAYGHGGEMIANALYNVVDSYAVALVEEGCVLRTGGIDKDILVLIEPFKEDIERLVFYSLTATACSLSTLKALKKEAKRQNKCIKVHIKVDTGMNRQGVKDLKELEKMLKFAALEPCLTVEGIYSHLYCPENEGITEKQVNKFLLAISLAKRYNKDIKSHISASGGFLKGHYFDMVRIGILLYGYKPFEDKIGVKPIMKVVVPVIKTGNIKAGENLLYGDFKAQGDYSLIRFGYADGLERRAVKGQLNNRCMDVTAVKGKKKRVVIRNVNALAKEYGTISYEILCNIGRRAERIYIN